MATKAPQDFRISSPSPEPNTTPCGPTDEGQNEVTQDIAPPDYNTTTATSITPRQPLINRRLSTPGDDYGSNSPKSKRNCVSSCCKCNWYVSKLH